MNECRREFEKWWASLPARWTWTTSEHFTAFLGWQAAWNRRAVPIPAVETHCGCLDNFNECDMRPGCLCER